MKIFSKITAFILFVFFTFNANSAVAARCEYSDYTPSFDGQFLIRKSWYENDSETNTRFFQFEVVNSRTFEPIFISPDGIQEILWSENDNSFTTVSDSTSVTFYIDGNRNDSLLKKRNVLHLSAKYSETEASYREFVEPNNGLIPRFGLPVARKYNFFDSDFVDFSDGESIVFDGKYETIGKNQNSTKWRTSKWWSDENGKPIARLSIAYNQSNAAQHYRVSVYDWKKKEDKAVLFEGPLSQLDFDAFGSLKSIIVYPIRYNEKRNHLGFFILKYNERGNRSIYAYNEKDNFKEDVLVSIEGKNINSAVLSGDTLVGYLVKKYEAQFITKNDSYAFIESFLVEYTKNEAEPFDLSIHQNGNFIVVRYLSEQKEVDFLMNLVSKEVRELPSNCSPSGYQTKSLVAEYGEYKIQSFLSTPKKETKDTLFVYLKGGPKSQANLIEKNDTIFDVLRSRGENVLRVNYVGSSGYGLDFSELDKDDISTTIIGSVLEAVSQARRLNELSHVRSVFVLGHSFGGYIVLRGLEYSLFEKSFGGYLAISAPTNFDAMSNFNHSLAFGKDVSFPNPSSSVLSKFCEATKPRVFAWASYDYIVPPSESSKFFDNQIGNCARAFVMEYSGHTPSPFDLYRLLDFFYSHIKSETKKQ